MRSRIIVSTLMGNTLECFDFILFIHFYSILATLFFPNASSELGAFMILSVSAIGFCARPIGGALFGSMADKYGRKKALSRSILWIITPTLLIGCMPTFHEIGFLAPLCLLICRILQSLALGGEYCNAGIFLMESSPLKNQGFRSSLLSASGSVGSLMALGCVYLVNMTDLTWAWRVPFIFSAFLGILGYKLRQATSESLEYVIKHTNEKNTHWKEILKHGSPLMLTISTGALIGVLIWMPTSFTPFYLVNWAGWHTIDTILFTAVGLIFHIIFCISMGILSPRFDLQKLMNYGAIATLLLAYPLFYFLTEGHALIMQIGFSFLGAIFGAMIHATMINFYPVKQRGRAISLGFMLGSCLGGASPTICVSLIKFFENEAAPAFYIMLLAFNWCIWKFLFMRNLSKKPQDICEDYIQVV